MSKRPNKMGRIEGEPKMTKKEKFKKNSKAVATVLLPVLLVVLGVLGTLRYQAFIDDTKQKGVNDYILLNCDKFADKKDKSIEWLECDIK